MTVSPRRASATKGRKRLSRETASLAAPNAIPASALEKASDGIDTVDPGILERAISEARSIRVLGAAMASNPYPASPELARSLQAEENWWREIENEFTLLNSSEVAVLLGAKATNHK